ncbi:MAG TPA: cell division protein ZapA [Hyphomicrobium sp.]|nr:cell division protein ZapA [Hyphomicrobium sp.]
MGQVAVTVFGRSYRFDCGEGEEARLGELAAFLKGRVEELNRQFGNAGEERLLLMAALLIADELWDARAALAEKQGAGASQEPAREPAKEPAKELTREAAAERREQEAIRAEHRRRATAPVEG